MIIQVIEGQFTVCKVEDSNNINLVEDFCFVGKTDEEISLVCRTESAPGNIIDQEDGWKAFRILGVLEFSLIGILSKISTLLADNNIGLFVISTFNTDYILVKETALDKALQVLKDAGYGIQKGI